MALVDPRLKIRGSKNGRDVWTAELPLPADSNGRRRKTRFTFVGNRTNANKALLQRLAQIQSGGFVLADRITFGQFVTCWLASAKAEYASKSWERFESMSRVHLNPTLGEVRLQSLSAQHLNQAYRAWRSEGLSGRTVLHQHRLIHRILRTAVAQGRVRYNAAASEQIERPRVVSAEMHFLDHQKVAELLRCAEGTPYKPLIAIALATGARLGELVALKWEDVDFLKGTLAIRRALESTRHAGVREKLPKNGRARVVDLPASAIELLRRRRAADPRSGAQAYIFPAELGGPWNPQDVTDQFRSLRRKARLGKATFHSLRHTAATQMLELGIAPKIVQERLGHSTIAITMDLYSHATPSLQADAARRLDRVLAPLLSETDRT